MRDVARMSILITGCVSGIGACSAAHFAAIGARVTISGRRADRVGAAAEAIGPNCRAVAGDVTVDADRRARVAAAV